MQSLPLQTDLLNSNPRINTDNKQQITQTFA